MKLHDPTTPPPGGAARAVGSPLAGCSIEAVLHAGPVFTLYRAVQASGRERVVIKEYCPQALCERGPHGAPLLRDPDDAGAFAAFEAGRAAFVDELHTLQPLRLPGLVQVRGILETEGSLCAVLPLLPGVTLAEVPLPPSDAALHALLLSLLEPLAQLHAAGLVHGALHERQLLWASGHMPVLLGFGLAAQALGPPPPQGVAQPPELDPRSAHLPRGAWTDVYALAALVMGCLAGRPWTQLDPADAADGVAARLEQALGPAAEPLQRRVLVKALCAALAAAPDERPPHAGALRELLGGSAPLWQAGREHEDERRTAPRGGAGMPGQGGGASAAAGPRTRSQPEAPWPGIRHPDAGRADPEPSGRAAGAPSPQRPARMPGHGGAAGWDRSVPAFRQGDAFVMLETPRQRNDSLRILALTLAVGLVCGAMGWWVHGVWQEESERHRINQLIAQAATRAPATPGWSAGEPPALPALAPPVETAALAAEPPALAPSQPQPQATARAEPSAAATPHAPPAEPMAPALAQTDGAGLPAAVADVEPKAQALPTPALLPRMDMSPAPLPSRVETASRADAAALPLPVAQPAVVQAPAPAARAAAVPRPERAAVAQARPDRAEAKPAPRPVSARADTPPARAGASPRNTCGALSKYALLQCMQRQCVQPSQRKHPQCQRLLNDNVLTS